MSDADIDSAVVKAAAARSILEGLVEEAKADVGAPYKADKLQALACLQLADPAEFARLRTELKKNNIRVTELDKLIKLHNVPGDGGKTLGQGRPLNLPSITPASGPVDGQGLMRELVEAIGLHVVTDRASKIAIACWCIMTHMMDHLDIAPRLVLSSPEKGCGKSTAMDVVGELVLRPLACSNITPSALFRCVEAVSPTLLIDEADTFARENDELRGIINSGHRRSGAFVIRNVGDDHEPRQFCTWAPMVLAGIGNLPGTIMDRSVVVNLRRKLPDEHAERLTRSAREALNRLAGRIARWVADNAAGVELAPALPSSLQNRTADNWEPLIGIADAVGGSWGCKVRDAAIELTGSRQDDSFGVQLLRDVRGVFAAAGNPAFRSPTLVATELAEIEGSRWADMGYGKPITPTKVTRTLKPFGVMAVNCPDKTKGYKLAALDDACARYIPEFKM